MVDDRLARAVEPMREMTLGDRHADGVRDALPQWAGRRLHAGRQPELRMPGGLRTPLAEAPDLREREVVASEEEKGIEQHRAVAGGQDKAVPIRPGRVLRVVAEETCPEHVGHR